MKKLLSFLLSMLLIISICPLGLFSITASAISGNTSEFAGGNGIEDDPYLISTKTHLNNMRKYPSACFKQISNISFEDKDYERNGEFYNFGYGWEGFDFNGSYNGNSYSINNLQGENGLFNNIKYAVLENIYLNVNLNIEKDLDFCGTDTYFGCLANTSTNSTVRGCRISGKLNIIFKNSNFRYDSEVGGFFGKAYSTEISNSVNSVSISGSANEGDIDIAGISCVISRNTNIINCENKGSIYCSGHCAGIVHYNSGGKIENCKNEGEIGNPDIWWPAWSSAGICVWNSGEIKNCQNSGKISAYYEAGGIAELSGNIIYGCVNYGECNSKNSQAGGIVALIGNYGSSQILQCVNYGKISAYGQAGGIVGYVYSGEDTTISECTNSGNIHSMKSLSGGYGSGGIVGELEIGTISKSKNFGEIGSYNAAGGICGNNQSIIIKCYNSGKVCISSTGVNGGGVAGVNYGTIENCYNIAKIKTNSTGDINIGGIAGLTNSGISNCYNISQVDSFGNYGGICGKNDSKQNVLNNCIFLSFEGLYAVGKGYGEALSTSKETMKIVETYENFDFQNIWTMDGNTDYPYPELQNVEMICNHLYDNECDSDCNLCGASRIISHNYEWIIDGAENCGVNGVKHEECNVCHTKRNENTIISATGNHTYDNACDTTCNVCKATRIITHAYKTTTNKATLSKNGSIVKKCTVCGKMASTTTIKYAKTFKLSTTDYTYNGKVKMPGVTVKDSAGRFLKKNTDYTVTYASGRKNVGKYKVTVTFKGNYSGYKNLYFTINPVKTTVKSLTEGKKSLKVNITKKSTQITGYQIQYSTNKYFKSAKSKTLTSYKTTSTTLSSLFAKKTYYVRVRTYKTVSGVKYYSGWSTTKYKKTK